MKREETEAQEILDLVGVVAEPQQTTIEKSMHPALAVAIGGAFLLNFGMLLSIPPVILGRGAHFVPTLNKGINAMFSQLRKEPHLRAKVDRGVALRFVDLGSGDGRVVFRAAREGFFHTCTGYEINPLLHLWAQSRRILQAPIYWSSTDFALRDIWTVNLSGVDVVAVYGLDPIMQDLGKKLEAELTPGSVVVSNVFKIPGWRPSKLSQDNVHIYTAPSCWEHPAATEE